MTQHPRFPGSLMTALGENLEWYIGRDGQQFGPVSSTEMGKLIELGHLKPTDLVWRTGFADWQQAERVFNLSEFAASQAAQAAAQRAAPSRPAPPPQAPVAAPQPTVTRSSPGPDARGSDARRVEPRPVAAPQSPVVMRPEPQSGPDDLQGQRHGQAPLTLQDVSQAIAQRQPTGPMGYAPGPGGGVAAGPDIWSPPRSEPPVSEPAMADREPRRKAARPHPPHDHSRRRRRGRSAIVLALVGLTVIGSAAVAGYFWREQVQATVARLTSPAADPGPQRAQAPAPQVALTSSDALASGPLWTYLKTEFPEWTSERLKEAQRLRSERKDDAAVTRYLTEQLVQLRRNFVDDALGASPASLKKIAHTFVNNLLKLNRESVDACYSFISNGEASGGYLPYLSNKELSDALQEQLLAVFHAAAEGRRERQQPLPPRKSDYDQLARMLVQRGWSTQDLQVFSDPRALGRAPPVVVCRLVREWFQTQLALEDTGSQVRLLVESLRPVVGG